MKISVIGCGYVGLVTGACLAATGHEVFCADNDSSKIQVLEKGKLPIYESHLDDFVARTRREGRLRFTTNIGDSIRFGEVVFICVGTPPLESGDADLSAIDRVARIIATESQSSKLVVEKSTVPVQTGRQLQQALQVYGRSSRVAFRVASNPEFLREGTAVSDFLHPDRIVVGVDDPESERQLREIYRPVLERGFQCPVHQPSCPNDSAPPFIVTTINSAELIKHASNSFLALKISYANAIADLCEGLGARVDEVTHAMGLDPRIGPQFLRAGLGFGGFCLPKDIQAFIRLAERAGVDFSLLKEAERINRQRIDRLLDKAHRSLWVIRGKQIGVLGLAFKAHTDDIRFSPAIELLRRLLAEGAQVHACDPEAIEKARPLFPDVEFHHDPLQVAKNADALILATEWPIFQNLDWKQVHGLMARPLIFDGRNLLNPAEMIALGFEYHSFGRPE